MNKQEIITEIKTLIKECEDYRITFKKSRMATSEHCSSAMVVAYKKSLELIHSLTTEPQVDKVKSEEIKNKLNDFVERFYTKKVTSNDTGDEEWMYTKSVVVHFGREVVDVCFKANQSNLRTILSNLKKNIDEATDVSEEYRLGMSETFNNLRVMLASEVTLESKEEAAQKTAEEILEKTKTDVAIQKGYTNWSQVCIKLNDGELYSWFMTNVLPEYTKRVTQICATQSNAEAMREHAIKFHNFVYGKPVEKEVIEYLYNQYLTTLTK